MRILIAEDDLPSRELLADILENWGYSVYPAANGAEAVEKLEEACPDLVLLDLQMPVMDGFAALERIRRSPRFGNLPVLALTACAMREDRERTRCAGFDAHIVKPVQLEQLRNEISAALRPSFRPLNGRQSTPVENGIAPSGVAPAAAAEKAAS